MIQPCGWQTPSVRLDFVFPQPADCLPMWGNEWVKLFASACHCPSAGTLKEALKHPVDKTAVGEIDGEATELFERHLLGVSEGTHDEPKVTVIVDDGVRYVSETESSLDFIIIDSACPMGPGEPLLSDTFFVIAVNAWNQLASSVFKVGRPCSRRKS